MCSKLIRGTGNDGGSLMAVDEEKARFVDESPWRVKGRSRRSAGSVGTLFVSTGSPSTAGSFAASCARRSFRRSARSVGAIGRIGSGSGESSIDLSFAGTCERPGRAKASRNAAGLGDRDLPFVA